jgi:putative endonuclease
MFYVYVLWSNKLQKRYVGFTSDLTKRLSEHNSGKSPFTKSGLPWKLIYSEKYSTETEARSREKFLKSGVGRKFLDLKLSDAGVSASI